MKWILLFLGVGFIALLMATMNDKSSNSNLSSLDSLTVDSSTSGVASAATANSPYATTLNLLKNVSITPDEYKKIVKASRVKSDEFSKRKYFQSKASPAYVNYSGNFLTVVKEGDTPGIIYNVQYASDDWLFIRNMTFLVDGETFDYVPEEMKRDNGSGGIWEWSSESMTDEQLPMVLAIANGKKVKVKYNGSEYYKIVVISPKQQAAMRQMLKLYKGMLLGFK